MTTPTPISYAGNLPVFRDLQMFAGNTVLQTVFTFTHTLGTSVTEATFTVRNEDNDIVLSITKTANPTQWNFATSNVGKISLLPADTAGKQTGEHSYGIRLEDASGNETTFQAGIFWLRPDPSDPSGGNALAGYTESMLKQWSSDPWPLLTSVTYHATYTYAPASATINWPDGGTGTYTTTGYDTTHGEPAAWTMTYALGAISKTVTQTTITRDASGRVTTRPALTVA